MVVLSKLLDIVAPYDCLVCGREGSIFCSWCQDESYQPVPPRCYKCQKATDYSAVCKNDQRKTKVKHLWAYSEYQESIKKLIRKLKFERAGQQAAQIVANLIDSAIPYLPPETIVTFVPTASIRRRQRGYDQAELIAKAFARRRQLICLPLLRRLDQTRQVGTKGDERRKQLAKAFGAKNINLIKGATVLLIDDVLTTGATMEFASLALKANGAKEINGAVLAQASPGYITTGS
jgi:ComF family protein